MNILINVVNQKLKVVKNISNLISGTQKFIRFKFILDSGWDGLTIFAQFIQNGKAYNDFLDKNNCVYLPPEIVAGEFKLLLYGSGSNVIATTNYLTLNVDENAIIADAQSTEISQSLYDQLVTLVQNIGDKIDIITGGTLVDNLIDPESLYTGTESGVTISRDGDTLIFNGTSTAKGRVTSENLGLESEERYVLEVHSESKNSIGFFFTYVGDATETTIIYTEYNTPITITVPRNTTSSTFGIEIPNGVTYSNDKYRITLHYASQSAIDTVARASLDAMTTALSTDVGKVLKVKTVTNGKVTAWEFGEAGESGTVDQVARDLLSGMNTASSSDVGKALKAKTVANGKVTEWEFGETGGTSTVDVDTTLTIEGEAADAKVVGDRINDLDNRISVIEQEEAETVDLLLGSTPQTLSSDTHTKLITDSTADYSIITPIADYENNSGVTLTNVTQTSENGKIVFTATGDSASECYVDIFVNGLTIDGEYNFTVNRGAYISGTTAGYYRISDSNGTEITSFDVSQNTQTVSFTATTSSITIRLIPSADYYWETYNIRTATIIGIKLESEIIESYTKEIDLGILSTNATITSTPESKVYAVLKKDEISKSLIGYTPLTINEESNIELSNSTSTQYTISNIFVADYDGNGDDAEVRLTNTTITKENGKMIFTATGDSGETNWADLRLDNLTIGDTYTLTVTRGEYISGTTGGYFVIYDRDGESLGRLTVSNDVETINFIATTTFARVRLYPTTNYYWEMGIKTATIINAIVSTQTSGTFDKIADLGIVSTGIRITSNPACQVYTIYPKEEIRVDSSLNENSRNPVQNKVIFEAIKSLSTSHLRGKNCVFFGDSVSAFQEPPYDIPSIVGELTGMNVINGAFGGCRITDTVTDEYGSFSFVKLVDAIISGDWTQQDTDVVALDSYEDEYSPTDHLAALKAVNWNNVDIIVVHWAGNDPGNVRIDDPNDDENTIYYLGAFRYCVRKLWQNFPQLKILYANCTYHAWPSLNTNTDDREYTIDGQTYHYYDWGDAIINEAKNLKFPTLDLYRTSCVNPITISYYMGSDMTHPKPIGNQMIAEKIAAKILSEF